MDPNTKSKHLEKPKNLATLKRPKNKRKEKQSKSPEKPIYHLPKVDDITAEQNESLPTDAEPESKRIKLYNKEILMHKYHSPKRAPNNLNETKQDQTDSVQYRRSPRVPRVTAKYLESIQAELRDTDDE